MKKKIIFVVLRSFPCEGSEVLAVYSKKNKAEDFINKLEKLGYCSYEIEEFELDKTSNENK